MSVLVAVILGLVQGFTEFLPVSSSGHLVIFQELFGINNLEENYLFFDILLHLGTVISICLAYSKDIYFLIKEFFHMLSDIGKGQLDLRVSPYRRMIVLIIVGTIPAVVVGLFFKDIIEVMFKSIRLVGYTLLVTGFLLWITNKLVPGTKDENTTKYSDALAVGIFQGFAIIPGISRSGSTIVGGLLNGLQKEFAIKLSFFLLIPATLGAAVLQIPDLITQGIDITQMLPFGIGMLTAAATGLLAIKFLIRLLNRGKFYLFSYYCWAVGLFAIVYSVFK